MHLDEGGIFEVFDSEVWYCRYIEAGREEISLIEE